MHRPRTQTKRRPRRDDLGLGDRVARRSQLELGPALLDVPRLVLLRVELARERMSRLDEEDLAAVVLRKRPDQLVAPRLVDALHVELERLEPGEVRRGEVAVHGVAAPE